MGIATEIVQFKVKEGVIPADFIVIVDHLEQNFHKKQAGFLDTELLYDEKEDKWYMLQHWRSLEEMRAASKAMFADEGTRRFREVLDTRSITMAMLPQIRKWMAE